MYTYIYTYVYIYMYIYIYIYVYIYTYIHATKLRLCMYVHLVYIYMYIYTHIYMRPKKLSMFAAIQRPRTRSAAAYRSWQSFHMLDEIDDVDNEGYVPAYLTQDRIKGRFQQRYELMLKRREMAGIYHTSHGHCNNRQTVLN